MKPPAEPSSTSEPPTKPTRIVFDGVLLPAVTRTEPVPPNAAALLMISEPPEMTTEPV
ncbi:MAG: hypothetical protein QM775_18055 [Pirellulales bacterium]